MITIIRQIKCTHPTGRHTLRVLEKTTESGCSLECVECDVKFHVIAEQQMQKLLDHTTIPAKMIPPIEHN